MKEINAKKMVNVPLAVAQALYGSKGLRPVVFRCRKPLEPGHQPGHCVKYTCIFKVCIRPNKAHGRTEPEPIAPHSPTEWRSSDRKTKPLPPDPPVTKMRR